MTLAGIQQDAAAKAAINIGGVALGSFVHRTDQRTILGLFADIESKHVSVDILVNNAGIALPNDFLSHDVKNFERVINVNLKGRLIPMLVA